MITSNSREAVWYDKLTLRNIRIGEIEKGMRMKRKRYKKRKKKILSLPHWPPTPLVGQVLVFLEEGPNKEYYSISAQSNILLH